MALHLVITESAKRDLLGVWLFFAEQDPEAADETLQRIEKTARLLRDQPEMGVARPELAEGMRSFPVGHWLLVYFDHGDRVVLTRVFDGRRDPARLSWWLRS